MLQIRRDTAANWASNDPTPSAGQPCYETDTGKLKVGDGATAYSSLDYINDLAALGVTATASELNILDGATLDVTELNYVDGVTSAIQTQLDGKLASSATPIGKQTIYIPASAMIAATTSGPASAQQESATNDINYQTLAFDASADEHAHFNVAFPKSWNLGTVTFQVFWSSSATDTDGVAWGLQGIAISDNEAIDTAWGTAVVVTDDAQSAADELYVTAESGAVTIGGTPADDDLVYFRVFRDVSDANDDMAEDALLIGIKPFYTTDASTDA